MIIRKRHTWRDMAAAVLLCAGLASCSQDDIPGNPQGEPLPGGEYPLMLTASVDGIRSRAAGKDAWTDGDEIGVRIGADGAAGRYKLNADGTVKEAATPVYWKNSAPATVKAWYPYETQADVDISDQSEGFAAFDFLVATADNQNYATSTELKFQHRMAKVSYTLQKGNGITDDEFATATVSISGYTRASFTEGVLTGESNGWITPTSDGESLLVPQDMTGKPFIKVNINDNTFTYTPSVETVAGNLEPGMHHSYTITLKTNGIEVTKADSEWTDGGSEDVTSKTVLVKYTAADVKKGDYIYQDGTTSDGGLRKIYTDGSMLTESVKPQPNNTPDNPVVGIVFWVPSETITKDRITPASLTDDKIMAADYPNCTHGLAVSLVDVTRCKWQKTIERVASTFQNSDNFSHKYKSKFVSIASNTTETSAYNYIYGYQNTQVLLAYNSYCKTTGGKEDNIVRPVEALEIFSVNHPAPANSTGWFIPSVKELYILCNRDEDLYGGTNKMGNKDIVNNSLTVANGSQMTNSYWTSLEMINSEGVFFLSFFNGRVQSMRRDTEITVRAVCAF